MADLCHLPPLILHPFGGGGSTDELLEGSNASLALQGLDPATGAGTSDPESDLERKLIAGRYQEIRMLLFLGKDLSRWLHQCVDCAERSTGFDPRINEQSFAGLLVESPPASVRDKLERWGVSDRRAVFSRAIGINSMFSDPPPLECLVAHAAEKLSPVRRSRLYLFSASSPVFRPRSGCLSLRDLRVRRVLHASCPSNGSRIPAVDIIPLMSFPRMLLVKQNFPDRRLHDIPATVEKELGGAGFGRNLKPGASVAIGVGSRGISNIATIVKSVVRFWKDKGMNPFIFPAMGSHGAATAEGQADVLAHYGIIEETVGCPVRSSLEVISLGKTPEGIEAFLDKHASESDGIMLVGRIKQHTDFAGKIESGLYKMMGIGLGKWAGAKNYHTHAYRLGMEPVIRSVGTKVLNSGKILGGLAILEDAYHNTAKLAALPVDRMLAMEEELQALVKTWAPALPFDLDVLMINQIGKQFSGAGMDTKVVNRGTQGEYNPWPNTPKIERIFLRDLSSSSYGNGVGLGLSDVVHDRLAARLDPHPTWINALTASTPSAAKLPIHFSTDRECLERICLTVGKHHLPDVRIGWIENTMELTPIGLSENMRPEIEKHPLLEIVEESHDLPFDAHGNLPDDVFSRQPAHAV